MYRYEVTYWNSEISDPEFEKGIVAATDYGDAANKVVDYYGQENIIDIKLYILEYLLTDEDIKVTSQE